MADNKNGMLSPYRVLDLTDEKGWLCGKLLGDLGADVIKIEPPGGDPGRNIGPFYKDNPDPEKSLYWFAYNTSKRGITLDIEANSGQETFKKLVKGADFVIESYSPGYLDKLGLGYSVLEKLNPGIILVSITPFGQTGPYKDFKGHGIVPWAMSGHMYPCGNPDRPPVQISYHPQAYLNGGADAAAGAVMALHQRHYTGEGQQVDVSIQQVLSQCNWMLLSRWDKEKTLKTRAVPLPNQGIVWECKDGHVVFFFHGHGIQATWYTPRTVKWMESEGMAPEFMTKHDWVKAEPISDELLMSMREAVARFLKTHTKAELFSEGMKWDRTPYPMSTVKDSLENIQLAARNFWVKLEHPELGTAFSYPGAFTLSSEVSPRASRRAPLIGEHNQEIFKKELNILRKAEPNIVEGKSNKKTNKPLEGLKVVEFSIWVAGAQIGKTLALYGAEVIKVEGKTHPDPQRTSSTPGLDGTVSLNGSVEFNQLHTGKRSLTLDLTKPGARETVKKLVAWADVLIENYSGEAMKRIGLDYEELKKVNPDLIYLGASLQGHTGPYAASRGVGQYLNGLTGFYQITGWPDKEPTGPDGPYSDYFVPRFAILALMSALDYRRRTGKGQYLDMSQYEVSLHFQSPLFLDYSINGRIANRMGNRYDYAAPHNAYRCLDRESWCIITLSSDEDWEKLCKSVETQTWRTDPRLTNISPQERMEIAEELGKLAEKWKTNHSLGEMKRALEKWAATHSVDQVIRLIQPTGATIERLPTGIRPVNNLHNAYRCLAQERYCAIAILTDEEWRNFCKVIGDPEWVKESRFSTLKRRKENEADLDTLIESWTINHSAEEIMSMMQSAGVGAGVVQTVEDVMEIDPQLKSRHLFWELDHPVIGKCRGNAPAFFLSKGSYEVKRSPLLGEDNEYVCKELLGMSDDEIAELVIEGAIE
jgi:crotonobetainyl-CoA:carnitine CoA-transferase CaiB-like acyl-CoA transferase